MNGGLPGARSKKTLVRNDGTTENLPSKVDHVKVEAGDLLLSDTWGGGGCDEGGSVVACGDPALHPDVMALLAVVVCFAASTEAAAASTLDREIEAIRLLAPICAAGDASGRWAKLRLDRLSALYKPKRTVYAQITFVDTVATVAGGTEAAKGQDLFTSVRNNDALAAVLGDFGPDARPLRLVPEDRPLWVLTTTIRL